MQRNRSAGIPPAIVTVVVCATMLGLAGCATPRPLDAAMPDAALPAHSASSGALTTRHPVTVLDRGTGAELCVGGVAQSLPPQCGGPLLIGWDWSTWDGQFEEVSGVRWGEFVVTGDYTVGSSEADAGTFTVAEVRPATADDHSGSEPSDFGTPCPEPEGGWRVLDESTTTPEARDEVFARAEALEGYSVSWVDQSPNPAAAAEQPDEWAMNDPALTIVNVAVVGDTAAAEAALREVWGGMLCVTTAECTAAELDAVAEEVVSSSVPGFLGGGRNGIDETIGVWVVYDDGTLQSRYDQQYGPGVVEVQSALVPAS
ncbi:hypothetical protein [Microbacterium sp.]|uniref:hypothetical protein n=1 Tax=Microbacterium sp. TaxID=51671 RepID=UPI003C73BBB4